MSTSKEQLLQRIRQQLSGVEVPELPEPEARRLEQSANAQVLAEEFQRKAEAIGVQFFDSVASAAKGFDRIAVSDGADLPIAIDNVDLFEGWNRRADLLEVGAGLTCAQLGIAESGTLALIGNQERHRLVSLVPPVHICLLRRQNIVGTMNEALSHLHGANEISPIVTFVTGPSRTADIELQLVLGVHGPRELRIVLT